MRLNKWLVDAGVASARRKADEVISSRTILVNGQPAGLGQQVLEGDTVTIDGEEVTKRTTAAFVICFYKPVGILSSHKGQGGVPTVFDLLPLQYQELKLIGRLDKDSEGLLVLTNDGTLVQELSHPSRQHSKLYHVWLDHELSKGHIQQLLGSGVVLDDGSSKFDGLESVLKSSAEHSYAVTLHEGRNRQIRRTFEALGYRVRRLKRMELDTYTLGDLKPGEWTKEQAL